MPLTVLLAAPGRSGCFHATRSLNARPRCASRLLPDRTRSTIARWHAGVPIANGVGKRSPNSGPPPFDLPESDALSHQDEPSSGPLSNSDRLEQPNNQSRSSPHDSRGSAFLYPPYQQPGSPHQQSERARRRHRPSPNAFLLKVANHHQPGLYFSPLGSKVDLSYNNVRTIVDAWGAKSPLQLVESRLESMDPADMSLQSILAGYIDKAGRDPAARSRALYVFSAIEISFLRSKGYNVQDVTKWASVIMNRNPTVAARYFASAGTPMPLFLILFFLRRVHVSVDALAILLSRLRRYDLRNSSVTSTSDRPVLDPRSFGLVLIRLVRHARQISPIDLPDISSLLTYQMEKVKGVFPKAGAETSNFVYFCNRFLTLLSAPASRQPFISSSFQETAQFNVLRAMSDHEPPIPVTHEGYRALARVQLAHKKTEQEQEWALLKSKAWPPWKESRTAMDEDKGVEAGISRAGLIMQQMYAAGYPPDAWEENATIYAGWDTDGSPTIQTRHNMPNVPLRLRVGEEPVPVMRKFKIAQWAARVSATRTRREAWACFLAYENTDLPAHQDVYLAMFKKLQAREVSEAEQPGHSPGQWQSSTVFPGDGKEVFPEPTSIHEIIHVSEPVPSHRELLNRMMAKGVSASNRFLVALLEGIRSKRLGVAILERLGDAYGGAVQRLLSGSVMNKNDIEGLPGELLVEILNFFRRVKYVPPYPQQWDHGHLFDLPHHHRLNYVFQILVRCRPDYKPVWSHMLRWINADHNWQNRNMDPTHYRWRLMRQTMRLQPALLYEPDDDLFQSICEGLQRTAINYHNFSKPKDELFALNSQYIRSLFQALVRFRPKETGDDPKTWKHKLMSTIPSPSALHAYIRALGLIRDFEGLYSLASWIRRFHPLLLRRADTQVKGRKRLRDALVGMRFFLERSWVAAEERDRRVQAPDELIELVKGEIESAPDLEGWPTDKEIYYYVRKARYRDLPDLSKVF